MIETIDGSFAPLSFATRAPGEGGIAVRLRNNNDFSYLASVLMGTPPQQIQMAASLSQNFISVASPPPGVNDVSFYNPSTSTSYAPGNATAAVQAISGGTVQGHFAGEICALKSATSALSFTYNASVLITDSAVTNDLYPLDARAILGYGVGAPTSAPAGSSLIGTFLPANFTNAVCGIELNHMDDPFPDGILTMGAVDPTVFTGAFTNVIVPQDSPTSWSIPFDTLTYLAKGLNQSVPGILSSVDIYHTGIKLTSDLARQIYSGIQDSKPISETLWSIPCTSKFPLTLSFAGQSFTIYERDTIVKQADGSCTGVVTGGANDIGQIGAPFLRNVYTQFGADKASDGSVTFSVGFAAKNLRQVTATSSATGKPISTVGPTATAPAIQSSASTTGTGIQSSAPRMLVRNFGLVLVAVIVLVAPTVL
ncbi:hypothetical protein GALMADRAFT_244844 [Galerina marginata CBS 339.88]|uniref:Peptidase A1 domain-containing protein n=1 Tax=Galerina marginata (strain CBS 339.88) TaxID=685588 RepID=A0A067T426_GALM3|nr:hypothetical protein GALMADRAFT_244844 [Galerina marginata CBS 339.88]